jgi:N-acetyl-gamma-glutamyl-phosphate reductase common form
MQKYSLGIIGGRGYVGKELLTLLVEHPQIDVDWISSRQLAGQSSTTLVAGLNPFDIENLSPAQVGDKQTDIVVLALPNGLAAPYVAALDNNPQCKVIIDLSADYRFDDSWSYSLPELDSIQPGPQVKISNPGCYATAMQLAVAPIIDLIEGAPHFFGVSGYSGAGTKPSPNNDPQNLKDNLIGYGLIEHLHEKEVSSRVGRQVFFSPHVAEFFRGINMTVQLSFKDTQSADGLYQIFSAYYADHPLVICKPDIPVVKQVVDTPNCLIGGFKVSEDGKRATIVSCLDNLLKGAASQALQNINLALGLSQTAALSTSSNKELGS